VPKQSCKCKSLYSHQQFDACIIANGMEPKRFFLAKPNYAYLTKQDLAEIEKIQLDCSNCHYMTFHEQLILRMAQEIHFLQEQLRD